MQTASKLKLLTTGLLLSLWTAAAGEARADDSEDAVDREPVVLKVPRHLRKYKLRIGGERYTPRDETLEITPYGRGKKMYVEVLDGNSRMIFGGFRNYHENALRNLPSRSLSIGLHAGASFLMNADAKKLFASPSMNYLSASAQWQPSLLGVSLSSSQFRSHTCYGSGPCGRFDMIASGAAVVAEVAPFTQSSPFLQRLHLALHLGATSVRTKFSLSERDVGIEETDVSNGKFASLEFRVPVVRVWLDFQHGWHQIPVELKSINYRRTIRQDTYAMGVRYAF